MAFGALTVVLLGKATKQTQFIYTSMYLFKFNESVTEGFSSLPISNHFTAEKISIFCSQSQRATPAV